MYEIVIEIEVADFVRALERAEATMATYLEGEFRMPKKERSPFSKGRKKIKDSGGEGGQFLSLADGDTVQLAPMVGLDGLLSADMHEYWDIRPAIYHPCIGRGCPGDAVGNDPRFKGYLPVVVKGQGVMIYPFTISVYKQLEALEDALDDGEDLKGFVLRISRKGTSLSTRYTVLGVGKRVEIDDAEIPDFIDRLGPQTVDEIWELLEENGFDREDADAKPAVAKPPKDEEVKVEHEEEAEDADDDEDWGKV